MDLEDLPSIEFKDQWLPDSFLSVLDMELDETSWNRLLHYFLNPKTSPFNTLFIENFLYKLREYNKIGIDRFDFENITVKREEPTPENNQIDIIIKSTDWFIWIELKVDSKEGDKQTKRYFKDNYLGKTDRKENYDQQEYLYIAPPGNEPKCDEFQHVTWRKIINWIDLEEEKNEIGKKQLDIFLHAIEYELGVNENMVKEKCKKYLEYWNDNADKLRKLEKIRKKFEQLIEDYSTGERNYGIEPWWDSFLENPPESWNHKWNVKTTSRYGQIYLDDWESWKDMYGLSIHLEHHPHSQSDFKNGKLKMELHCETYSSINSNARELRKAIRKEIDSSTELEDLADQNNINIKNRGKVFFKKEYIFQVREEPIKNRTKSLRCAFDKFEPIAKKLNDIVQKKLQREYRHS